MLNRIKNMPSNCRAYVKHILCLSLIFTQNLWGLFTVDIGGVATGILSLDVVGTANVALYIQQPDGTTITSPTINLSDVSGFTFDPLEITDPPIGTYHMGVLVKGITDATVSINKEKTSVSSAQVTALFRPTVQDLYSVTVRAGEASYLNLACPYIPLEKPFHENS